MNKLKLVEEMSLLSDIPSSAAASRILEFLISKIKSEVLSGNEVNISGLGKFSKTLQKGRSGIVPGTDKSYTTSDKMVPKFRASSTFKALVAGGK